MLRYSVVVDLAESEPVWVVTVPALPGCVTQGDTIDDALTNAREAIAGHVAALTALGRPGPVEASPPTFTILEIDDPAPVSAD